MGKRIKIDYAIPRGLDHNPMKRLASLEFIRQGQNLFITGLYKTGKSFLATAIGLRSLQERHTHILC
ncbi:ATP-binding protein [Bacteroides faecichinchillae]|uniref:ATP-binding protein n=1 Tax=Bacteroides faecichinchillae TaxID=871325 RepID=UPI00373FDA79